MSSIKAWLRDISSIGGQIDREGAVANIRSNIYFRGPNVWILAFSIIIASVGLNVNSTAVIIGAMLISPLMGPIIGIGLSLGTNDSEMLRDGSRNLLIMVLISLAASSLYFVLSPLNLVNPTELEARTSPTIYDVIIALFGGFAGIIEQSRREKGTVLSGVAIATALMPPLCTAGYGLAHLNWSYFFGALFLFIINTVFIIVATYVAVKYLHFEERTYLSEAMARKTRRMVTTIVLLVAVPSIWSAILLVRNNNFASVAEKFVAENRYSGNMLIYDYRVDSRHLEIHLTGEALSEAEIGKLVAAAERYGIPKERLSVVQHSFAPQATETPDKVIKGIYDNVNEQLRDRDRRIEELERQIGSAQIPYSQVTREASIQYPEIRELFISRGATVDADSLNPVSRTLVMATLSADLDSTSAARLTGWLRVRLEDSTVTVVLQK